MKIGSKELEPEATLESRDRLGPTQHRIAAAWSKCWTIKKHLLAKAVSPALQLASLRNEVLPVLNRGCTSWHMRRDTLDLVDAAVTRMARLVFSFYRPADEPWLKWHVRSWRAARQGIVEQGGCTPAAIASARAVAGVQALASRSACSLVGRMLRWRCQADVDTVRMLAGGHRGGLGRRRKGRPGLRWEARWLEIVGTSWWDHAEDWHGRAAVRLLVDGVHRKV